MIIKPRIRGFICITAHPDGCAAHVAEQIAYVRSKGPVHDITIESATEQEIADTVAVMGGEDWEMWIDALQTAGVLADGALTVAYSYIGPDLTHAIYRAGTIGRAKEHLESTAKRLQ